MKIKGTLEVGSKLKYAGNQLDVLTLGDFATGGSIGTAITTVDIYTNIRIAQSTTGQTLTLPSPTVTTDAKYLFLGNTGSVDYTAGSTSVAVNATVLFFWNGTAWVVAGGSGGSTSIFTTSLTPTPEVVSTITHNLNKTTPSALIISARDVATGDVFDVIASNFTTNAVDLLFVGTISGPIRLTII